MAFSRFPPAACRLAVAIKSSNPMPFSVTKAPSAGAMALLLELEEAAWASPAACEPPASAKGRRPKSVSQRLSSPEEPELESLESLESLSLEVDIDSASASARANSASSAVSSAAEGGADSGGATAALEGGSSAAAAL